MKFNLNEDELLVLKHAASKENNKEIAARLSRQEEEIKLIMENIYKKLGVTNRLQAILKYYL